MKLRRIVQPWQIILALTLLFIGLIVAIPSKPAAAVSNPIQIENAKPGSRGWEPLILTTPYTSQMHAIEGYSSQESVRPGETFDLHISTAPAARYRIEVYRLGWYNGLGGRLIGCLPTPNCSGDKQGSAQPLPVPDPVTGMARATWPITDSFTIPEDAVSGYYSFKLILTSGFYVGQTMNISAVVREPANQDSTILVQVPYSTWQAYNGWGGKSLYVTNVGGEPAVKVSFDRPYDARFFPRYEYNFVRFLEREGYDVSYQTDTDTHRDPAELLKHRLIIPHGHDEYWSKEMRDGFEAARAAGISLAFIGADIADWQIRYEDNERTVVEYRDANKDPETNPALKTILFRDLVPPRPTCELLGVQYQNGIIKNGPDYNYTVNAAALSDPWFFDTGFIAGHTLINTVGYEFDAVMPGCAVPPLTVFFHYDGSPSDADAIRYTAPSGARVFSTGSLAFVHALDGYPSPASGDARLQKFMRNVLNDLSGSPINKTAPTISGITTEGQTLSANNGTWMNNPTSFSYQWRRCDASGANCFNIAGANGQAYIPVVADIGSTVRVVVTAINTSGSTSILSAQSAPIQSQPPPGIVIGNYSIGLLKNTGGAGFLDASGPYTLSNASQLSKLTGFVAGGKSDQPMRAVIYTENFGRPGSFVAVSSQRIIAANAPAAWTDFPILGSPNIPAGKYWLGYWYGNTSAMEYYTQTPGAGRYAPAPYSSIFNPPSSFGSGTGSNTSFSLYATFIGDNVLSQPPVNTSLPQISGMTTQGQALSTDNGTWDNSPTSFTYQWRRCDSAGSNCIDIDGAVNQNYLLALADVGNTIQSKVTASNSDGSTPAMSLTTGVVEATGSQLLIGKTTIGQSKGVGGSGFLDASGPYSLPATAQLNKLTGYLAGGTEPQPMRAILYTDNGGRPGNFVAVSSQMIIPAGAPAAWMDFPVLGLPSISAGKYWIGYWYGHTRTQEYYDLVSGGSRYAPAPYSSAFNPPSNFGSGTGSNASFSLYATFSGAGVLLPPVNTILPVISGTAIQGQTLNTDNGTWENNPTSFNYQWRRCDSVGASCSDIAGATASSYVLNSDDVNNTLRALVTATSNGGSASATSLQSEKVAPAPVNGMLFGKNTIGSKLNIGGSGFLDASGPYTLLAESYISKLSGYIRQGSAAQSMRGVIYADNGSGRPGNFVAVTSAVTVPAGSTSSWTDFPFANAPTLAPGKYWLGYWYGNTKVYEYYDPQPGGSRYAPASYSSISNPPSSFGSGTGSSMSFSLYAVGNTTAGQLTIQSLNL